MLLLPTATYRAAAFVEAARRAGVELTVASELPSTFESAQPAGLLTLDFHSPQRAAEQARAFAAGHPIAAALGVDDDTTVIATAINAALGLRGNPVDAAVAARDKHRQRVLLAGAGVRVPGFALHRVDADPERLSSIVRYPCVLKPLRLSASRGVIRADDREGFVHAFRRLKALLDTPDVAACGEWTRELLVEDYVPGVEVALEGLLADGRLRVLALFDKPDPLEGPFFEETIYVTPSRLSPPEQGAVAQVAQDAVRALGLREGPVHAELRVNADGAWLIELAARPIGGRCSAALRFRHPGEQGAGSGTLTLEDVILRHALGRNLAGFERESGASGVMMIPIPRHGALRAVGGVAEARAVPLIEDMAITIPVGQEVVPLPEGSRYLGFIFARGDEAAAVEGALREAHRRLDIVIG